MEKMMKTHYPENNEFLTFSEGVIRSEVTDVVIAKLEPHFKKHQHHAKVTSVIRNATDQLRIINRYALDNNIHCEFPIHYGPPESKANYDGQVLYMWQHVWSKLLNIGILINPPLRAKVLFDYWRGGVNKKGRVINPSAHSTGRVFDISGAQNGISDEVEIISGAIAQDPDLGLSRFILERRNNALHCICK